MEGYTDIPVENIINQYGYYMEEIEKKAAEFAANEIRKNIKKFYKPNVSANLQPKWWKTTGHLKGHVERKRSRFHKQQYVVGVTSPHAHLLEYGHAKWIDGQDTGEFVPGSPFIRPAEDALIAELQNIIQNVLNNQRIVIGGR
ncbi:HK97 gp10 family phage protein [Candidatus Saccharibacteria bacterium]|nr:HK97 gp10 family phage protein [Candidatus Saccharibacteria bacterium]